MVNVSPPNNIIRSNLSIGIPIRVNPYIRVKQKLLLCYKRTDHTLVNYLVSKILGKIQGTEMLVDLENLGTR